MKKERRQFFHEESYGERSNGAKTTAQGVLSELARVPAASRHVKTPMEFKPLFVALTHVSGLMPLIHENKAEILRLTGHSVRIDAQVLLGAVVSYPETMETLKSDPAVWADCMQWQGLEVEWLKKTYQSPHLIIGTHWDENHPHLHAVAPAYVAVGARLTLGMMHAGQFHGKQAVLKAEAEAQAKGIELGGAFRKWTYNEAFKSAERARQLDHWLDVGMPMGMTKTGQFPRKRVLRGEALARSELAEALEKLETVKDFVHSRGLDLSENIARIARLHPR